MLRSVKLEQECLTFENKIEGSFCRHGVGPGTKLSIHTAHVFLNKGSIGQDTEDLRLCMPCNYGREFRTTIHFSAWLVTGDRALADWKMNARTEVWAVCSLIKLGNKLLNFLLDFLTLEQWAHQFSKTTQSLGEIDSFKLLVLLSIIFAENMAHFFTWRAGFKLSSCNCVLLRSSVNNV